jgi:hypothetical protein
MAESTASSVTKNRIKTNYHGALEGFAPSSSNNNNNNNQQSV